MERFLIISILIVFHIYCFSQEIVIKGKVIDSEKNSSLSYSNIGIAEKGVGTVSDINGDFRLKLKKEIKPNDTIQFSFIGYQTKKIIVSALFNKDNIILLEPKSNVLGEVIVAPRKFKLRKIGKSSAGLGLTSLGFYSYYDKDVDDRLSKEMGMKLDLAGECKIKSLSFKIAGNQFKSVKFRVNFYNIKNGLPDEQIVSKNIIAEIPDKYTGWYTIDLAAYDIYFDKGIKEIAATIQWVDCIKSDPRSKFFNISASLSPFSTFYYRDKALNTWIKIHQNMSFYLTTMVF